MGRINLAVFVLAVAAIVQLYLAFRHIFSDGFWYGYIALLTGIILAASSIHATRNVRRVRRVIKKRTV